MTATLTPPERVQDPLPPGRTGGLNKPHYGTHLFLLVMALIWLVPLV